MSRTVAVVVLCLVAATARAGPDDPARVHGVAVGDFDGDGKPEVAVGLPELDFGESKRAGVVRIYSGATGGFLRQASGESADERFGTSIAAVGDVDGDGATDLAVSTSGGRLPRVDLVSGRTGKRFRRITGDGAWGWGPWLTALGDGSGSRRVDLAVRCNATGWLQGRWRVVRSDTGEVVGFLVCNWSGEMPWARAVGDVDGDGQPDLAIANFGAWIDGKESAGIVHVVSGKRFRDGLADADLMVLRGARAQERLGLVIGAAGDWDGDGKGDVLIGVPGEQAKKDGSWLLRVFSGKDGSEVWRAAGAPGDASMSGVALVGDADGDGRSDVAVGTRMSAGGAGAVTALSSRNSGVIWSIEGGEHESLGDGVWPCADADGDGVADVVVLAPGASRSDGAVRIVSGKTGHVIRRIDPFTTRSDVEIVKDATAPKTERRDAARRLVEAKGAGLDVEPILAILEEWLRDASFDRSKAIELIDHLWRTRLFNDAQGTRVKRALVDVATRAGTVKPEDEDRVFEERAAALLVLELGVADVDVRKLLWTVAKDETDDVGPRVGAIRALAQGDVLDVDSLTDWIEVAKSKDEDVRQSVADNLFRAKAPEFDAVLEPLLFDAKNLTRAGAIESQTKRHRPTMLARFDELMEDGYEYARFNAMYAAGVFKDETNGRAQRAAMILRLLETSDDPVDVTGALLAMTMLTGETFGVTRMDVHVREQEVEEKALAAFVAEKAARKQAADAWRAKFGVDCVWTDADRAKTLEKLLTSADPDNVARAKTELETLRKAK